MQNLNSPWMGAARTLACALVVLVHIDIYVRTQIETWWPFGVFSVPVFGLAVPVFFILSGYSTTRISHALDVTTNLTWLKRKLRQLVLPFLFWNAVMLSLHEEGPADGIGALLYWLTGYWHLYFVFVLFQLLIVSFVFERYAGPRWPAWMLAAGVVSSVSFYAWSDVLLWTELPDGGGFEIMTRRIFLVWFIFYAVGVWLRYKTGALQRLSRQLPWLAALAAISYLAYVSGLFAETYWIGFTPRLQMLSAGLPFQILGAIFLLTVLYRLQDHPRLRGAIRILAAPSRYTYGIYLCHVPVLIGLVAVLETMQIPIDHWIAAPALAVAVWLIAQAIVRLSAYRKLWIINLLAFGATAQRQTRS